MAPQRGSICFWCDGFYKYFAPNGAGDVFGGSRSTEMARLRRSGCGGKRVEDHRDFAPDGAWGVGGNGLGITEISPLRGLRCFWWGAFYRDGAPTALGVWGKRFGDHRDFAPTGFGVFWCDGFYRDGAPTALGLWGKRFGDDGAHARIAQSEHRRCDISVAARAEQHPQSSVRSGIVAHAPWRPR